MLSRPVFTKFFALQLSLLLALGAQLGSAGCWQQFL